MNSAHPAFSHIVAQTEAISFLSRALATERLPHALLFAGPTGVGKYTTAVALATVFLAHDPNNGISIQVAKTAIEVGTHPNFHVIRKELIRELHGKSQSKAIEMSVDVIRERLIVPASKTTRLSGGGKVFVVEEAESMTISAQNALLKTLEEPSGRTLIVLLTDQPHALLSTIRSRTQMVRFCPMGEAEALAVLAQHDVEAVQATPAVRLAGGSPGLALRWIQDGVAMSAITLARLLDNADPQRGAAELADFLKAASEAYAKKQVERDPLGSEDGFKRAGIGVYLRIASDHLRKRLPDAGFDQLDRTCDQIDAIRRAEAYIDGNVNTALVLQQIGTELASSRAS